MYCIVQRVSEASVEVEGKVVGEIGHGLLVLVGVMDGDTPADIDYMERKLPRLRIFGDAEGKMNRSVTDLEGGILLVSQFTLAADNRKGTRPSFQRAMKPQRAKEMFDTLVDRLRNLPLRIETGVFAADMKVRLVNDGPVTIPLDSRPPPKRAPSTSFGPTTSATNPAGSDSSKNVAEATDGKNR